MPRQFDVNNARAASDYAGAALFAYKEYAVSIGYTVRGTGDGSGRFAYDGVTAALPVGQQGSGGDYDCWQTGAARNDSTPAVAGDAGNANAWAVLERGAQQILLTMTSGTGLNQWNGYARMAYNPGTGATPAFNGAVAAAATIPGAATNEFWLVGSRGSAFGDTFMTYNVAGYYHIWGDDTPAANGGLAIGFAFVQSSDNTLQKFWIIAPIEAGTEQAGDPDPTVALWGGGGPPGSGNNPQATAWNPLTGTMQTVDAGSYGAFWNGRGNSMDGVDDAVTQMLATISTTVGSRYVKGIVSSSAVGISGSQRGWGNWGVDQNGLAWAYWGNTGGALMPWPDAATIPLP